MCAEERSSGASGCAGVFAWYQLRGATNASPPSQGFRRSMALCVLEASEGLRRRSKRQRDGHHRQGDAVWDVFVQYGQACTLSAREGGARLAN